MEVLYKIKIFFFWDECKSIGTPPYYCLFVELDRLSFFYVGKKYWHLSVEVFIQSLMTVYLFVHLFVYLLLYMETCLWFVCLPF